MTKKVLITALFIVLILGISITSWLRGISHKIFIQNNTTASAAANSLATRFNNKSPFTILLLGYGGGTHDGANLTDSIIVVHVNPKDKTLLMLSIPRDLWVKIPTNGQNGNYWKINTAYAIGLDDTNYPHKQDSFKGQAGGGNMAKEVVKQVTGLAIDTFVALDFTGFKHTIDALGGVDITVEKTFDDYEYPAEGKETDLCGHTEADIPDLEKIATISALQAYPCRYLHLHFNKGLQHMDGDTALKYVRSRHSLQDGTDFGRSKRQKNLIIAAEQKVFSIGFIPKIIPFTSSLQDDLRTDLTPDDARVLVEHAQELKGYSMKTLALTTENFLVEGTSDDGQAIILPEDGKDNFGSIHNWIASYTDPNAVLTSPIIQIANASRIAGLAELATNRLKDKDFNVLSPITAAGSALEDTTLTVYNEKVDKSVLDDLMKEFGIEKVEKKTSDTVPYDILITVGKDYNQKQGKKLIN